MSASAQRYTAVAIVLHWAIAFAILLMIPFGWWMGDQAEDGVVSDGVFQAYQLHKSIGLTVLALSLLRLGWRLANPPPPMPAHMPGWERVVAATTHWAFYVLMIAMPLTGWVYVSTGWSVADDQPLAVTTHWFGLFTVPHLFGLADAGHDVRAAVADASMNVHSKLAWGAIVLAVLHAGAALKHHLFDKDSVLAQMVPGLRAPFAAEPAPKDPVRLAILGGGLAIVAVAITAWMFAWAGYASSSESAPQTESNIEITETAPAPAAPEVLTPAAPGEPSVWRVDAGASSIGFAFTYSDPEAGDTRFEGRFTRWRADIRFDPANLEASSVVVIIETASATDGVAIHDRALPGPEWFNAAAHPNAIFRARAFRHLGGDAYEARGELSIKGQARNYDLPFTLRIDGDRATMSAQSQIDRHEFDIGEDTDADEMISRQIDLAIRVEAARVR